MPDSRCAVLLAVADWIMIALVDDEFARWRPRLVLSRWLRGLEHTVWGHVREFC